MTGFKQTFFGKLWAKLKNIFEDGLDDIEAWLKPIVPQLQEIGKEDLKRLAAVGLNALKEASANGSRGKGLIDAAFDAIKVAAIAEGKDLFSTTINQIANIVASHAQADATETLATTVGLTPLQQASKDEIEVKIPE